MGSMRFVRATAVEGSIFNQFEFDSEPRGTIDRALGVYGTELRERPELETTRYRFWDAYAKSTQDSEYAPSLRGQIRWEKPEARDARLG